MTALIIREVRRSLGASTWMPIAFFLLVAALVPFGVGPDARLLAQIGGGVMWVAALLAAMLPVERLIEPDLADGTIDQLAIRGVSEEVIGLAKATGLWLSFGPLLLIAALPAAAMLGVDGPGLGRILLALAIGTPALASVAVAAAALTAGLPRGGMLASIVALPVTVPLLIFGAAATGLEGNAALKFELAVALLLAAGSPFVTGAAIRAART
ncbi:heme exporter protein CcmB [Sphingomicrobium marinum]|uniref:heme exporter protein CcmB n=1 Tax=Sphingomicrobium marinum TaxID=1227950 RepID=UPI00223F9A2A|nr:heme exporter protein CcmB [Sphingomicrobium marinum]